MIAWRRESSAERPWATWVLMAVTLLAPLGAGGSPDVQARLGLVPVDPRLPALLGHLFLHSSWLSLLATLFFVAAAGPWLEAQLGRRLFVVSYVSAGLAGAVLFVAMHPQSDAPWLGASAAVAGALGLLAMAARGAPADLLGVLAGRGGRLDAPAWALAALWVGGELAGLVDGGGDAVAAHAVGFGFGVALAVGFEKTGVIERAAAQPSALQPDRAPRSRARTRIAIPQNPAQLEALLSEATDPAHARAYLAHAEAEGRLASARDVVAERFAEALEWRRREPAIALWCALQATGPVPRNGTDELLQLASWLRGAGHAAEATGALHAALASADANAAAKIARAARRSDPVICYRAAERALEDGTLGGSDRRALEGLRSEAEREVTTRGIILVPGAAGAAPAAPPREPPAAARALAPGEAIELPAEQTALPTALPDPERSGEAVFLDAFHAALHEGAGDEAKPEAAPLRSLRVREATPCALEDDTLVLEVAGRSALRLRLTRVHAVALAAVRGISERAGDKPVLLVDLCLSAEAEPELQVLRLRSDRFDPRRLAPGAERSGLVALRAFVSALAAAAHAPLLPTADVAGDAPLRIYRDLATYQREVLRAA